MSHKPIIIKNLGLSFQHKTCFEDSSTQVNAGDRIAIIGRNGSGKSTLLKMLHGQTEPTEGTIHIPSNSVIGYVPQVINELDSLSGGQRFNEMLTQALALDPDILLLDEPTNHLDAHNRRSLMRMLNNFEGTLIVVSHDVELLRTCITRLWHINEGRVDVFSGNYDDYLREKNTKHQAKLDSLSNLNKEQKKAKQSVQREQERAAQSRKAHKGENDTNLKRLMEQTGERTAGKKSGSINKIKNKIEEELSSLRFAEEIKPKFALTHAEVGSKLLVSIANGSCGYNVPILEHIRFSLHSDERIAINGKNASGKSTLIKGILNDIAVQKTGEWHIPRREDVGYLDQHYKTLDSMKSVFETIQTLVPQTTQAEIRLHLNNFLFRKNEEVNALVSTLSGGERARLCLAQIAAKTPKLLILDEITNNLDLETREHVMHVISAYPGAMIVVSHDSDFLKKIGITSVYKICDGRLLLS